MKIHGFYGVLNFDWDLPDLREQAQRLCRELVRGGASVIQLRGKQLEPARLAALAHDARRWTRELGVPLVINDHPDLAHMVQADGVHLGQDDMPVARARRKAPGLVIGLSTHTPEQARQGALSGADYLGFGPVFATSTKQNPDPVQGLEGLRLAVQAAAPLPVVAIGGIGLAQVAAVRQTGAAAACVIGAVNHAADVVAAARAVSQAWA